MDVIFGLGFCIEWGDGGVFVIVEMGDVREGVENDVFDVLFNRDIGDEFCFEEFFFNCIWIEGWGGYCEDGVGFV